MPSTFNERLEHYKTVIQNMTPSDWAMVIAILCTIAASGTWSILAGWVSHPAALIYRAELKYWLGEMSVLIPLMFLYFSFIAGAYARTKGNISLGESMKALGSFVLLLLLLVSFYLSLEGLEMFGIKTESRIDTILGAVGNYILIPLSILRIFVLVIGGLKIVNEGSQIVYGKPIIGEGVWQKPKTKLAESLNIDTDEEVQEVEPQELNIDYGEVKLSEPEIIDHTFSQEHIWKKTAEQQQAQREYTLNDRKRHSAFQEKVNQQNQEIKEEKDTLRALNNAFRNADYLSVSDIANALNIEYTEAFAKAQTLKEDGILGYYQTYDNKYVVLAQ